QRAKQPQHKHHQSAREQNARRKQIQRQHHPCNRREPGQLFHFHPHSRIANRLSRIAYHKSKIHYLPFAICHSPPPSAIRNRQSPSLPPFAFILHLAVHPPSTIKIAPVTYDDASEARKTTGPTSSSALPRRPSGVSSRMLRSFASSCSLAAPGMYASMYAGLNALTRMLYCAHSTASVRVNIFTPPLLAL